jgi:dephospho-CoA kinase
VVFRLGLTGGIGSGKSTVAALLADLGARVIDADAISRAVTGPQGAAMAAIQNTFGPEFILPSGALDRERMRATVFTDPAARQGLEAIVHPLVQQESEAQTAAALAQGVACLVYDLPLLVESGRSRERFDAILVVDCLEETQITRVMARSGLDRAGVLAIMANQASRTQRLQAADVVIFNDGLSLEQLAQQVQALSPRFGLSSAQSNDPSR